jgi:hypothetical protein
MAGLRITGLSFKVLAPVVAGLSAGADAGGSAALIGLTGVSSAIFASPKSE